MSNLSRLKSRGRWWWHERYYSVCSAHFSPKDGCSACSAGRWINTWQHNIEHAVYVCCYPLWAWWVNRPESPHRKFLEETFPGLRNTQDDDDWSPYEDEILLTDEVTDADRHQEG